MANVRTRACGTIQNAHYCNLAVVGSNHVTNKKKRREQKKKKRQMANERIQKLPRAVLLLP